MSTDRCSEARASLHRALDREARDAMCSFEEHAADCDRCNGLLLGWEAVQSLSEHALPGREPADLAARIGAALESSAPQHTLRRLIVPGLVSVAAVLLLLWLWQTPREDDFTARGSMTQATGVRVFCVNGSSDAPRITEVRRDAAEATGCKVGDVLQFTATVPAGSLQRCLRLTVEVGGEPLFALPGSGELQCVALPAGEVVNEPLRGGVRIEQPWAGRLLTVRARFMAPAVPDAAEIADVRVLRIVEARP